MGVGDLIAHPYITFLIRWGLAIVLFVAGISKLWDRRAFVEAVQSFQVLPTHLSRPLALSLPWLEIAVAAALALGLWTRPAAATTVVLLIVFSSVITINLARGNAVECNCFGPLYRGRISGWNLLRNAVLLAGAIWILRTYDGYLSLEAWLFAWPLPHAPASAGLVPLILTIVLAGLSGLLFYQAVLLSRAMKTPDSREYRD